MAITAKLYGSLFLQAFNEEHDLLDDTLKVMLTTSGYTPAQDTDDYKNDVTNEVSGTGYSAGGATLGSKTLTYTALTNKTVLDAADVQWPSSTITARTAVIYNATGGGADASRGLIGYQQSDADIISSGGNFDLVWHASGIMEITTA